MPHSNDDAKEGGAGGLSMIKDGFVQSNSAVLDNSHTLANLSKGLWHAEIINQAGKTLAKALYGANLKKARNHFSKAYNSGKNEISILYELSYGYYLLGEDEDLIMAKKYLQELSLIENKALLNPSCKSSSIRAAQRTSAVFKATTSL